MILLRLLKLFRKIARDLGEPAFGDSNQVGDISNRESLGSQSRDAIDLLLLNFLLPARQQASWTGTLQRVGTGCPRSSGQPLLRLGHHREALPLTCE